MKTCTKCLLEKPETDFNWKKKKLGIRATQCKLCHKQYRDKHYEDNKEKRLKQAKARTKKHSGLIQQYILGYLRQHPCIDCGESDVVVLEFDHRSNKKFQISAAAHSSTCYKTIEEVIAEVEKCDVRCANCHRRKTARFGKFWKIYQGESSECSP